MKNTLHILLTTLTIWLIGFTLSFGDVFTVTVTTDNNLTGSLRWAISQANSNSGRDTIVFSDSLSYPLTIVIDSTLGQISISDELFIDGTSNINFNGIPLITLEGEWKVESCFNFSNVFTGVSNITGLMFRNFGIHYSPSFIRGSAISTFNSPVNIHKCRFYSEFLSPVDTFYAQAILLGGHRGSTISQCFFQSNNLDFDNTSGSIYASYDDNNNNAINNFGPFVIDQDTFVANPGSGGSVINLNGLDSFTIVRNCVLNEFQYTGIYVDNPTIDSKILFQNLKFSNTVYSPSIEINSSYGWTQPPVITHVQNLTGNEKFVRGTGVPGATIELYESHRLETTYRPVDTVLVDSLGNWQCTVTTSQLHIGFVSIQTVDSSSSALSNFRIDCVTQGNTYWVTLPNDNNIFNPVANTLRWAIEQSNLHCAVDTIRFNVSSPIVLSDVLPNIIDKVYIIGSSTLNASDYPVIDGNFTVNFGLFFQPEASGSLIQNLRIRNILSSTTDFGYLGVGILLLQSDSVHIDRCHFSSDTINLNGPSLTLGVAVVGLSNSYITNSTFSSAIISNNIITNAGILVTEYSSGIFIDKDTFNHLPIPIIFENPRGYNYVSNSYFNNFDTTAVFFQSDTLLGKIKFENLRIASSSDSASIIIVEPSLMPPPPSILSVNNLLGNQKSVSGTGIPGARLELYESSGPETTLGRIDTLLIDLQGNWQAIVSTSQLSSGFVAIQTVDTASSSLSNYLSSCAIGNTYWVTSTADAAFNPSPNTLRWAIEQANNNCGVDTIRFSISSPIILTSSLPSINDKVIIQGSNSTSLSDLPVIEGDSSVHFCFMFDQLATGSVVRGLQFKNFISHVDSSGSGYVGVAIAIVNSDSIWVDRCSFKIDSLSLNATSFVAGIILVNTNNSKVTNSIFNNYLSSSFSLLNIGVYVVDSSSSAIIDRDTFFDLQVPVLFGNLFGYNSITNSYFDRFDTSAIYVASDTLAGKLKFDNLRIVNRVNNASIRLEGAANMPTPPVITSAVKQSNNQCLVKGTGISGGQIEIYESQGPETTLQPLLKVQVLSNGSWEATVSPSNFNNGITAIQTIDTSSSPLSNYIPICIAKTYWVTDATDLNVFSPSPNTLRWAIEQANSNCGVDTIRFDVNTSIILTTTLPVITDGILILGGDSTQPATLTTIDGDHITPNCFTFFTGSSYSKINRIHFQDFIDSQSSDVFGFSTLFWDTDSINITHCKFTLDGLSINGDAFSFAVLCSNTNDIRVSNSFFDFKNISSNTFYTAGIGTIYGNNIICEHDTFINNKIPICLLLQSGYYNNITNCNFQNYNFGAILGLGGRTSLKGTENAEKFIFVRNNKFLDTLNLTTTQLFGFGGILPPLSNAAIYDKSLDSFRISGTGAIPGAYVDIYGSIKSENVVELIEVVQADGNGAWSSKRLPCNGLMRYYSLLQHNSGSNNRLFSSLINYFPKPIDCIHDCPYSNEISANIDQSSYSLCDCYIPNTAAKISLTIPTPPQNSTFQIRWFRDGVILPTSNDTLMTCTPGLYRVEVLYFPESNNNASCFTQEFFVENLDISNMHDSIFTLNICPQSGANSCDSCARLGLCVRIDSTKIGPEHICFFIWEKYNASTEQYEIVKEGSLLFDACQSGKFRVRYTRDSYEVVSPPITISTGLNGLPEVIADDGGISWMLNLLSK